VAELVADDLAAFTNGRLSAGDDETQNLVDAALVYARHWCGWHVTPVTEGDVVTLDGPNNYTLWLPTKKLLSVTAVTENGTALNVANLYWSVAGEVYKTHGCWTWRPQSITATFDHGFTEDEAADWRRVVLGIADRMSMQMAGNFTSMTAGPFSVNMSAAELMPPGDMAVLNHYIRQAAFA